MSYRLEHDPSYRQAMEEARVRNGLIRSALIWTPLFLLSGGAFAYYFLGQLFGFGGGTWFLTVVLGFVAFLMGYQGINALRDLVGGPRETEGRVTRRWARRDSIVFQSHYIRLDKKIFRIDSVFHGDIKVGDHVRLRYYPASMVVLSAERLPAEDDKAAEALPDTAEQ